MRAEWKSASRIARTLIVLAAGFLSACASNPGSVPPGEVVRTSVVDHRELNGTYVAVVLASYRGAKACEHIYIRSAEGENVVNPGACITGLKLGVRTDRTAIGVRFPNNKWLQVSGSRLIEPVPSSGTERTSSRVTPSSQRGAPAPATRPVQAPTTSGGAAPAGPMPPAEGPPAQRPPTEMPSFPSGPAPYRVTPEPVQVPTFAL